MLSVRHSCSCILALLCSSQKKEEKKENIYFSSFLYIFLFFISFMSLFFFLFFIFLFFFYKSHCYRYIIAKRYDILLIMLFLCVAYSMNSVIFLLTFVIFSLTLINHKILACIKYYLYLCVVRREMLATAYNVENAI